MSFSMITAILDVILLCLLGVAIYYGLRLHRALSHLKNGREELKSILAEFSKATERAEGALKNLRTDVSGNVNKVKEATDRAQRISDDLDFLLQRGDKLADRLETDIRQGRALSEGRARDKTDAEEAPEGGRRGRRSSGGKAPLSAGEPSAPDDGKRKRTKSKSELLKALQGMR